MAEEFEITDETAERILEQFGDISEYINKLTTFTRAMMKKHLGTENEAEEQWKILIAMLTCCNVAISAFPPNEQEIINISAQETAEFALQMNFSATSVNPKINDS
jgi:hypothetical protein